ncbi:MULTISPECIES: hypothetical protein [Paenibacillus]|uniref:hypothetical protein n=1 Tax=Paenibacillus TaxID=44249 RepID=UPI0022B9114F|nr:hypothetical protein [Paenibacillus caseinilyticus]MCZ8518599.1 hypothetical protein [Paenibacillus caseinilyticus]
MASGQNMTSDFVTVTTEAGAVERYQVIFFWQTSRIKQGQQGVLHYIGNYMVDFKKEGSAGF